MKVTLGSFRFSAQYQQRPVPEEGEIIKWDWFRFYDAPPQRQMAMRSFSPGTPRTRPKNATTTRFARPGSLRGNHYYVIDILREKLNYPELKKKVVAHAQNLQAGFVIIENKGFGHVAHRRPAPGRRSGRSHADRVRPGGRQDHTHEY